MLDVKTIIFLSIFSASMMGMGLFAISGRMSNQRTIRLWAYGNFLQALGWTILGALRGVLPDVVSIVVGQVVLLTSLIIWSISLSILLNLKILKEQFLILGLIELISLFYFTVLEPNIRYRIIIISCCIGYIVFHLAIRLFESRSLNPYVYKFNALFYLICGITLFARAIYHFVFRPELETAFSNHLLIEQLSYFVFFCTSLMSPFGFLLITNSDHARNRKKFEEQIQLLTTGIEQSPISIVITDLKGDIEYVNPTFSEITGYSFEEIYKKNLRILKSGNMTAEDYKEMWDLLSSGKTWKGTFKNLNKSGQEYWEAATISPIKNTEGSIINYIGIKENITKQREMQEALVRSELKIQNIVNSSADIVYTLDNQGRISGVYGDWITRTGREKEFFIGKTTKEILIDSTPEADKQIKKALSGERAVYEWETKYNGKRFCYQTALTPWVVNGVQIGALGVGRDITELNRIQNALKENEKKLLTIFDTIEIGITITDPDGNIIDCNHASEMILGITKQEHLTRNYAGVEWEIIRPDFSPMPSSEYASVRALKENIAVDDVEMGVLKKDKSVTWIRVSASPMNLPGYGVVISYVDITSKKKAEMVLKESETKFKNFFNNNKSIFLFINPETAQILDANESAVKFYGYELIELKQKKLSDIFVLSDQDIISELEQTIRLEQENYTFKHRLANGEYRDVEVFPTPFEIDGKKIIFSVINDITERKKLEASKAQTIEFLRLAKEEAEKANRLKSEFLAHMSHDIRTPMNSVIGFAEIIKDKLGSHSEVNSELDAIQKSGKTLIGLLNDILDLARIEAGLMEMKQSSVNIKQILKEVMEIFASQANTKSLNIVLDLQEQLPDSYMLDELRIRQILLNLIGNAIKFTEKGSITFMLRGNKLENGHFNLTISILDTGIGIPAEELENVFEPFIQRKSQDEKRYGGSGLGLSITKRLVELMNGRITLSSELGIGTQFTIQLFDLLSSSNTETKKENISIERIEFSKSKILLVEDIEENRKVVRGFLRKTNLEIEEAENGKIALAKMQDDHYDLILMDIQMPVMGGKEASKLIKNNPNFKDIPIIILSADAMQDDIIDYKGYSDDYISKPVEKKMLIEILQKHLPNHMNAF